MNKLCDHIIDGLLLVLPMVVLKSTQVLPRDVPVANVLNFVGRLGLGLQKFKKVSGP